MTKNIAVILFIIITIIAGVLTVCLTARKPNRACQRRFQRIMKSSLVTSSQPRVAALGHLNKDHYVDIIIPNSGTNTIGILLSNGNGTFADQQTYSTGQGSHPHAVVINDFNNDNYSDIAVANYGTNSIGIFIGNGNGTFNDQLIYSLGSSHPLFLGVGDFNNDNRMDIATVNYGTDNIGILLAYGDGFFHNQTTYSTGYDSFPSSLVIEDMNQDNYLDIVVANSGTDNIGIFIGYGNGTFASQQIYTTLSKSNPLSIAVGDFNHDDKLDIVVSNNGSSSISLFLNHGNGSFQLQVVYSIDAKFYPEYITVNDMNNDDQLDIVVVDSENNQIHILSGSGNGSFAEITTYDGVSGSHPICVVVADFNNNNQSDIGVVNYDTSNVLVLIDYSIKPSARQTNYDVNPPTRIGSIAVADFNSDHIFDIVYFVSSQLYLRIGLDNGTFGNEIIYPTGKQFSAQYICVGDVNNDNQTDIIIADTSGSNVGVILSYGNGTFSNMTFYSSGRDSKPQWVALGDVNNDNQVDIISANTGTNTTGIFLGNGSGIFGAMVSYSTGIGIKPYSVAVGDLNHDNNLDLAVVTENGYVVIFLGHSSGIFSLWNVFSTGQSSETFAIVLGHFNGDKHLDIAVTNMFNYTIGVFLGNGNGTFRIQTLYPTGSASRPCHVITADFNNDNISDLIATNLGSNEVIMFYGLGNGSFEFIAKYSTGYGSTPYGLVVADLDNNKQLDIIVALFGLMKIAILTEYKSATFVNQTKYSTGSAPQPYSLAIGNFNNDNRSDIVVANSGSDNLNILFGLDNDTFDMTMKYDIGPDYYPQYVITCDVNSDGELDIVSVNSKANSISLIIGYGNGTFANPLIYSTGSNSHPTAVVAGDLNHDTRLDLIVTNEGTNNVGVFFGFNYTTFQNQIPYSSDDSLQPSDIFVIDLNNDTYLDIAAAFYKSNKIGILLGKGDGSFGSIITYSTGRASGPYAIAIGDVNNDKRLDIVISNYNNNSIGILLGYGNGSFSDVVTYANGTFSRPRGIILGDLNNDNTLDIVVANYGSNSVGVLLGNGNGRFSNVTTYSTGNGSASYSVALGDLNDDNSTDIVVANYGAKNIGVLFGYGNGTFRNHTILFTIFSRPIWLAVDDFNSDDELDIAVADWSRNEIVICIGYGNGSFATNQTYSSGVVFQPTYLRVGDFNNDNILDIAVANQGTDSIVVLFGLGDGRFLPGQPHSTGSGSLPFALAIGDFNNDGRLDITTANDAANNIRVFLANGSQPFASTVTLSSYEGSKPHSVAVNDFNEDGHVDIVICNYGTNDIDILFGYGNGNFDQPKRYSTGNASGPSSVAVADFNNDTHLDIVVTNSQANNIIILFGNGNGTFIIRMNYSTGIYSQPYSVVTGDFNNDHIIDISVAYSGNSSIVLFYGNGNGTFEKQVPYALGYNYRPY